MEKKLLIVTFANKTPTNYITSLNKFGYNYKIVGHGEPWKGFVESLIKGIQKYLKEALDSGEIDDNTIICKTDAFDVLASGPPNEFIHKFLGFNKDIVFGAENVCMADVNCVRKQSHRKLRDKNNQISELRYINAGFYAGYPRAILKMYDYIINLNEPDDQIAAGKFSIYLDKTQELSYTLDVDSELVYNILNFVKSYDMKNGRIYFKNETPCFVHNPHLNQLNTVGEYLFRENYKPITSFEKFAKVMNNAKNNIGWFIPYIVILIILIILIIFVSILK